MSRYRDWLNQAQNDLAWAKHSQGGGFHAQTCFIAQQASEKAERALAAADILRIIGERLP